jgi:hypothetical protein
VQQERPPSCRYCQARTWWNGWREVFPVVLLEGGAGVEREVRRIPRAKCSACRQSVTLYPDGFYPRRQYQLDVVADGAAGVAVGGQSARAAASAVTASATSARRWTRWLADLCSPSELLAAAARVDPDAPAGSGIALVDPTATIRGRAARVLVALEHMAAALIRTGVAVLARSGLGQVLLWQHRVHGDLYPLCRPPALSPAMALGRSPPGL